ncbi:hypothetical protein GCM10009760_01720 [Kitasatospora kazusensis]|uniref:Uncharacterized protein n=1 Tax=Kitasatospora kazusensis TaxID=407974 RepID=A0ABP5KB61_9ACTN
MGKRHGASHEVGCAISLKCTTFGKGGPCKLARLVQVLMGSFEFGRALKVIHCRTEGLEASSQLSIQLLTGPFYGMNANNPAVSSDTIAKDGQASFNHEDLARMCRVP